MALASYIADRFSSTRESQFLARLENDLQKFTDVAKKDFILLLPPLNSHYRFLTHKLVEQFPGLLSVSVGSRAQRRTAVFFEQLR